MKFLIDECLHTSLVTVAHAAGYAADHVNFLHLGGSKDWELIPRIHSGEYTFVTNNRADFLLLYGREPLHPGLVIIVPNIVPVRQRELFTLVLQHITGRDWVNTVLEVTLEQGNVCYHEYQWPAE